jgi:hypothetical protein
MHDPHPQSVEYPSLAVIRADDRMQAWRMSGETDRLVVCFSGVGVDLNIPQKPEFQRLCRLKPRPHLLFVADPARSWLNRDGLIEEVAHLIECEALRIGATDICALGYSMGAFSALAMPAYTRIDKCVAFSPQYSVDPAVVPNERRWIELRSQIGSFRISNVDELIQPSCHYFVFLGRHSLEAQQRNLVCARLNLDYYIMPQTAHNSVQRMKAAGVLDEVLKACLESDRDHVHQLLSRNLNARLVVPKGAAYQPKVQSIA